MAAAPTFSASGTPSFCAPAKIRILLVPAAPLEQAEFERWSSVVRAYEHIPLTDVPRSRPPPRAPVYEQSEVHLSFVTTHDSASTYLAPFQLHHVVHGVLGLATRTTALERVPQMLSEAYPHAFAHRVWAFDVRKARENGDMAMEHDDGVDDAFEPQSDVCRAREPGVHVVPAVRRDAQDVRWYVRQLLADMIGSLLDQLDHYVAHLDELETPRETLRGAAPPPPPAPSEMRLVPRKSTVATASKIFGLKKSSVEKPAPSLRVVKVKADAAMMSGYLWDALELYDSILTHTGRERALAGGHDAVWFAGALEGWAVTRVILSRMGGEAVAQAPCLLYPLTPGKDKDTHDPTPEPLAWRDVAEAYALALAIYRQCLAPPHVQLEALRSMTNETSRDYTPPYVYASACLQYARFLLALFASGGWNADAHDQLMYGGDPPALDTGVPLTFSEQAHLAAVSGIYRHEIAAAASAALTPSLPLLVPTEQLRILAPLHRICTLLSYTRLAAHIGRVLGTVVCSMLTRTLRTRSIAPHVAWDSVRDMLRWHTHTTTMPRADAVPTGVFASANPALVLGIAACDAYGIDILASPLVHVPPTHILEIARQRVCAYAYTDMLTSALGDEGRRWLPRLSDSAAVAYRPRAPFGWHDLQVQLLQDLIVQCEALDEPLGQVFFAALLLRHTRPTAAILDGLRHALPRAQTYAPHVQLRYWGPPDLLRSMQWHAGRVHVSLCNPWPIPLPLYDVHAVGAGLDVSTPAVQAVVPPHCLHTLQLHVVPQAPGTWHLRGVRVRLWGAEAHTLHIHKSSAPIRCVAGLLGRPGAQLVQWIIQARVRDLSQALERPPASLACALGAPRAPCHIRLPTSVVLLMDGASEHVRVALHNPSDAPIDVPCSVDDGQPPPHREASEIELYEHEWLALHEPVATIHPTRVSVAPHATAYADVHVRGRTGCDWVRLHAGSEVATLPLCVEPSVMTSDLRVERISDASAQRLFAALQAPAPQPGPYVLVSFHARNVSTSSLRVCIDAGVRLERTLPSGESARMAWPMAPMTLTHADLLRPIPALCERQYVVPKTTLSDAAKAQFWVREALWQRVRATWTTSAEAHGDVHLRALWPSDAHVPLLVAPRVHVDVLMDTAAAADSVVRPTIRVRGLEGAQCVRVRIEPRLGTDAPRMHAMAPEGAWDMTWSPLASPELEWTTSVCFLSEGPWLVGAYAHVIWPNATEPHLYASTAVQVDVT